VVKFFSSRLSSWLRAFVVVLIPPELSRIRHAAATAEYPEKILVENLPSLLYNSRCGLNRGEERRISTSPPIGSSAAGDGRLDWLPKHDFREDGLC
jgi:hypothetical protein